ncbi:hypothetical protein K388_07102 [Streptomyces sp. KhCrAH-43]|uniref:hypothetical protein n=1 Tax=unclassified Streptomyces TaxID=2593676 RepID=UPI000379E184|nr:MULTISPECIES: hypothetical protein [unclassified Streptomyces]MYS32907.1 hypothetical protein [Streptomyces sp. SID4920]MYX64302.1 hypothetical protein [Streptomyces sp. SID8373]RAJ47865.1 hypothetical protein K388_07102 [Streptomyces sp. KhCrAH-43]
MRRSRKSTPPTARETRPARPAPEESPRALAGQLYELHRETGKDEPYLERWPGDHELFGVLQFAQEHADRLKGKAYRKAAVLRIQLAEWLRLAADPFQLAAIDDARAGGTAWKEMALALRYLDRFGEPNPGSAVNLRKRLHVAVNGRPGDRRQPQVAHLIDRRAMEARVAEARFIAAGEARYAELDSVARALLKHRGSGEIRTDPDDDGFWWEQLAEAVDDRRNASERANLLVYVRGVTRETRAYAATSGRSAATTEQAAKVLAVAAGLVDLDLEC